MIPLGVGIYLIWYYYNQMSLEDRETTIYAIKHADYIWLLFSVLLGFLSHLSRAYRWQYTLEPLGYKPKLSYLYHAVMIGYIINLTIPRSGEASRAGFIYQTDKVPFSKSIGTIIAERAVDLIMLGIVTIIAISLQYSRIDEIKNLLLGYRNANAVEESNSNIGLYIFGVIGLLFIIGIVVLWKNKKLRDKVVGVLRGVLEGVKSILKSKNPFGFIMHTFIIWTLYVLMFIVAFKALPSTSDMPFAGSLIAFISGTVGLIFIPGGIGVYPALVGIVTTIYLFPDHFANGESSGPHPQAYAIGWLIWLAQTGLIVSLGTISLILGSQIRKKTKNEPTPTNP